MTDTVIFDLGNTLVSYYPRAQWPAVLAEAIEEVAEHLRTRGIPVRAGDLPARVDAERGERDDFRVRPLSGRLARIFRLSQTDLADGADLEMCRRFLQPIFALARRYDDVLPTLAELRRRGLRTGILSNTPWGSPGELWREELARHGLLDAVDAAVFCTDVGWRKPDPRVFEFTLRKLQATAKNCLFVGDDPRWDLVGPRRVGMTAVLIDRTGSADLTDEKPIRSLSEVPARLQASPGRAATRTQSE